MSNVGQNTSQKAKGKRQKARGERDPEFYLTIKKDLLGLHLKYKRYMNPLYLKDQQWVVEKCEFQRTQVLVD
ncbi:hypothetical protein BJP34_12780 [Moorena producens PAL-8-15-08-1]|uniref:Uncharacterized protein n=1 Tax=Moorena producens PAL-8-15-08-1 TaxID=1458985 RepID=A0A1D8TRH8_9CYAN|nr:hypothetical protein BJP34_12780 [Moorena producens PAL-8-15-08-1]